ncbi:monocarboxylate transporter 1-like isoform X2 [Lytechinus variegatus]|uniref:monocarboxylate transporter 1-like isoform X2 n=1 Tax=Lytechinus variegatus TaxID=7654 RepID=UPI001BB24621|nr:monocarboxylate transporter 1-like isoform X2 [Lytechinus variegatus]
MAIRHNCFQVHGIFFAYWTSEVSICTHSISRHPTGCGHCNGPLGHFLNQKYGSRPVTIIGGNLAAISFMAGTFCKTASSLGCLLFFTGLFASPLNQGSSVVLHQYHRDNFGLASAITMMGSQVGSFVMPYLTSMSMDAYGPRGSFLILSAMMFHWVPIGATLRSSPKDQIERGISLFKLSTMDDSDDAWCEREPLRTRNDDQLQSNEVTATASSPQDLQSDSNTGQMKKSPNLREGMFSMIRNTMLDAQDFVKNERVFACFLLPCQVFFDMSYIGWSVFLFPYGIAEGLPQNTAVFLVMMGSVGGITGRLFLAASLYKYPLLTIPLLPSSLLISSMSLLAYPINSSPTYLCICSFLAGMGLYNTYATLDGVISLKVRKENFPKAIACSLMVTGASFLASGVLTGFLHDYFGSYRAVFRILGSLVGIIGITITIHICVEARTKRTNKGL